MYATGQTEFFHSSLYFILTYVCYSEKMAAALIAYIFESPLNTPYHLKIVLTVLKNLVRLISYKLYKSMASKGKKVKIHWSRLKGGESMCLFITF